MNHFEARISELEYEKSQLQRNFELVLQLNEELRIEIKQLNNTVEILKIENKKLHLKIENLTIKPNQPSGSKPDYEKPNSRTHHSIPGQKPGHKGISRKTPTKIHKEFDYKIDCCKHCQSTNLVDFQRRSKIITDIEFKIVNFKENYHDMKCLTCGKITKPQSLHGKSKSPFGKVIQTLAAYLSSVCGTTKRPTENLFRDFFGVEISDTSLIN